MSNVLLILSNLLCWLNNFIFKPSNHLDSAARNWLASYLSKYDGR